MVNRKDNAKYVHRVLLGKAYSFIAWTHDTGHLVRIMKHTQQKSFLFTIKILLRVYHPDSQIP